ncbi:MAG: 4Fe-4S dicluster domain-containing protein [Coriobacteriia bacterium]|nr:4Fe-4S dicluster domain-containing protein [Coriobacteriia bacterium]
MTQKENLTLAGLIGAGFIATQALFGMVGKKTLLKPPGAVSDDDFIARCISCGKCALACPYGAIKTATLADGRAGGTPYIDARSKACRLCEDFPCVAVCPTGALRDIEKRTDVKMGTAVINEEICAVYAEGHRCEVCYRSCPLIDKAITIDYRERPNDKIHVLFAPIIHEDVCVGCGICVERCVISEPEIAIKIEPR